MTDLVFFKITGENRAVFNGEKFNRDPRIVLGDPDTFEIPGLYRAALEKWRAAGAIVPPMPYRFKVLDDDGTVYFWGVCSDDSSFEPLDDVGAAYGCTEIQYKNPATGVYETL